MSRTPLFRALRRCFRLARLARVTGRPVDEVVGEQRERERARAALGPQRGAGGAPPTRGRAVAPLLLDRRQLLRGAGAAAGLTLAGCRPFAATPPPAALGGPSVLIVGAGIAGLTAGYRLHQQGVPVQILEGQERVGGRLYSLRGFFPDDQVAELGGELIDTGHLTIRRLVEELGLALDDFVFDDPGLDRDVYWFGGQRYDEDAVVRAFVPVSDLLVADLSTLDGDWVTHREPNGGEPLDRTPLADWLATAAAEPWLKALLAVAYTTEFGLEPAEQSALNLLLMLDPHPFSFRIFGESDERFHLRGGNDQVPRALAERLGDRVETGTRVEAVRRRSDGALVVTVRRDASSHERVAEHVVLTVPFTLLRPGEGPAIHLDASLDIPPVQRRAIAELGYGTNAKLMVGFAERLWRRPALPYRSNGSTLTDLPYQLSWETSRLQPGASGILTNFTGGRHGVELGGGTPAEQAAAFAREIDRVFPGLAAARLDREARFHWPSHPWARGSYGCYRPGQWTAFAGEEGRAAGNLHFAGEHTSQTAQGFMEGGCESGERAAHEVLAARRLAGRSYPRRLRRTG